MLARFPPLWSRLIYAAAVSGLDSVIALRDAPAQVLLVVVATLLSLAGSAWAIRARNRKSD
jgi:hypothetical protein